MEKIEVELNEKLMKEKEDKTKFEDQISQLRENIRDTE